MSSANIFISQNDNGNQHVHLCNFPENSVIVFKTKLPNEMCTFVNSLTLDKLVEQFRPRVNGIGITDLAVLLYRCSEEEWVSQGHGAYSFPGFGEPFYAGTMGVETAFRFAAKSESPARTMSCGRCVIWPDG